MRNTVAERLLRLKFKELFSWHFMNADPHLGNFHYNDATGATYPYPCPYPYPYPQPYLYP